MAYVLSPAAAIANKNSNRGARDIADRATPSLPNGCAGPRRSRDGGIQPVISTYDALALIPTD
jgi:hypothetical protein